MKKNQLIKALVFTAVLAAFPAAGLSASAEDAAPADALAIDTAAPVAAQAEDVVLAPVEAAPVEVAPVVVEAAPAVDDAAAATAEGTDGIDTPAPTSKINPAPAPVAPYDTTGEIKLDDSVIKAGESAKISADIKPGKYIDDDGKAQDFKVGVRYFSSDNSIATVDPDGTVHAKNPGKVTIFVVTEDGTQEIVYNVSESYNVLLIDKTDSTGGKTLAKEKAAAISYAEEVLKINSESHVAVVQVGDQVSTKTLASFTNNLKDIKNTINGITASGEYSIYSAGIKEAAALLNTIPNYNQDKTNQNVLIFGDGAATIGDRDYAKAEAQKLIAGTNLNNVNAVTLYTFGVYDGATDAEKAEGSAFMKDLGRLETYTDEDGKTYTADHYYEVGNVADLKDIYKAIATKPVRTKFDEHDGWISSFDVVVYGKDCAKKKCGCNDSTTAAKKSASEASSPETAESNSIYVIALFALLGAGAMGVSAKKRFED